MKTAAELDDLITGRKVCKDTLPPEIVDLFRSFNPYKGGNDPIYLLNKLRNKTHTVLAPLGFVAGGMFLDHFEANGSVSIPSPRWDSEKNEMIFARVGADARVNYEAKFGLIVTFDDPSLMDNKAVAIDVLNLAYDQVAKIIKATESKCAALGFKA